MACIQEISEASPKVLQRFLAFEQRNLWKPERFRNGAAVPGFAECYLPERGGVFRLPCYWVPREYLYIYCVHRDHDTDVVIRGGAGLGGRILLPIHPEELRHYREFLADVDAIDAAVEGLCFWATATSSVRTLLVWPEGSPALAFFAKLSLRNHVLGDRRLERKRVAGSVGVSGIIGNCGSALPRGIRFFPEILGLVPRLVVDGGVIFRCIPDEVKRGDVIPAPLFSLIGGSEGYPPLLMQFLELGRSVPREALENVLLRKFADIWVELVFGFGFILEAHGQDLLLALSADLLPTGDLYYRDFEGLAVDWALRRARGLPEATLPHAFDWFSTYETWGYPMYQLVSKKMLVSLFDYVHLVLAEVESALLQWQTDGLMIGERIHEGELTFLFSRYLRRAIREKFGMTEGEEYDVRPQLSRFVKFLMRVRREVLLASVRGD